MILRWLAVGAMASTLSACMVAGDQAGPGAAGPFATMQGPPSPGLRVAQTPAGPMYAADPARTGGGDLAKGWGTLAQLAGTSWNEDDRAVYTYRWVEPGREFEIAERSSFGSRVARIVYDAGRRGLVATTTDLDSGETWQDPIQLNKKAFTQCSARSAADPTLRCTTYALEQGGLVARYSITAKTPPTRTWVRRPIDEAAAARLIAGFDRYPARARGSYDPRFGILGLMAGGDWRAVLTTYDTSKSICCGQPAVLAKLDGGSGLAFAALDGDIGSVSDKKAVTAFLFDHVDDGALAATRLSSTETTPEGTATVRLRVLRGGVVRIEDSNRYTEWHLAASGRSALAQEFGWTGTNTELIKQVVYRLAEPRRAASPFERLDGQIFRKGDGYIAFRAKDATVTMLRYVSTRGKANSDSYNCAAIPAAPGYKCAFYDGTKIVDVAFAQDASRFRLANTIYDILPTGDLRATTDDKATVYPRTSLLAFAFETQGKRGQDNANENYRDQARAAANERQRKADNDALWAGVVGGLARGAAQIASGNYGNAYSTARTDWGSAGSVAVANARTARGSTGAVGDMGGVTYEAVPAGHDTINWSQAQVDAFMDAQHAHDAPAAHPAESAGSDAHNQTTTGGVGTAAASQAAGAGSDTRSAGDARTESAATTAAATAGTGTAAARGSGPGATQRAGETTRAPSRTAGGGAGGASDNPALIVSSASADQEAARQAALEVEHQRSAAAEAERNAQYARDLAAQAAADDAAIKRREEEKCRQMPAYCDPTAKAVPR